MKKAKIKREVLVFFGVLAGFLLLFLIIFVYCKVQNRILRTYNFAEKQTDIAQDGLKLTITVAKQWQDMDLHPDQPIGAQYDGVIKNSSKYLFKDWQVEMIFNDSPLIDSSWNGDFNTQDTKMTVVAADEASLVPSGGEATFGAVMNSTKLLELKSYQITGYRIIVFQDLLIFKLLLVLLAIWILYAAMNVILLLQTRRFRERRELDMEIINQSISTFTGFIDAKDKYTRGHSARVARYAAEIASRLGMSEEEVDHIYQIGLMHDCGKIGIPDELLKKPGPLTDEEYEVVKSHTTLGDELLADFTAIPEIREGAHFHHERYDGQGYPYGLFGKKIPLCARIICIADSYDAMSSNRCYRKQLTYDKIVSELTENAGKQFDPELVPYMLDMMNDGCAARIRGEEEPLAEPGTSNKQ